MRNSNFQLTVSEDAELDILEGHLWYEEQKAGLGGLFLKELDNAFNKIINNPDYYHFAKANTRAYSVKKYPFHIIYCLTKNLIQVIAVFHTSRNPTDWHEREFSH
jgi:toxin ParE1/3/4